METEVTFHEFGTSFCKIHFTLDFLFNTNEKVGLMIFFTFFDRQINFFDCLFLFLNKKKVYVL